MRIRSLLGVWAVAVAVCCSAGGQSLSGREGQLRTLTKAREVHNLPVEEAAHACPVHLHAVVTYYDPYIDTRHGALFVCDSSGCVFVSVPARPILPLQAAQEVDLTGVTGPGDFAPVVQASAVRIIRQASLPANPRKVTVAQMLTGSLDSQWVEIEGRVRSVHFKDQNVALQIATDSGSLDAISVRQDGFSYEPLIDSLIRIRGTAACVFNKRRQVVGTRIFFATMREVSVIQAAPRDPFAAPAVPIAQLFRFNPELGLLHRVHVRGNVTLDWPGRILCLQEGKDGICMQTTQAAGVAVGSLVDVVGFPAINQFKPTLEDASFRATGQSSPSAPRPIAPGDALKGDLDGQVVQIDAELIGQDPVASDPTLILRAGQLLFPATLPKDAMRSASLWKDGSLLRVTGVYNVQLDPLSTDLSEGQVRPQSAHILLRSVADITVMLAPSWWTPQHTLESFAAVGLVILAAFGWIAVLRHRVDQQTRALRSSQERLRHLSEHDALTGLPNRLLLDDRLHTVLERADRFRTCLGLLMVDLDGFKEVNDAFGHHVGDTVLCDLAERLSACVRATDTVARMGGDEFIILLPDLHVAAEAEMIAAKIIAAASSPMSIDQAQVAVTVSIGVVTCPEQGSDAESLLRCADEAMYAAKQKGKNRFQVYRPKAAESGGAREQVLRPAPVPNTGASI